MAKPTKHELLLLRALADSSFNGFAPALRALLDDYRARGATLRYLRDELSSTSTVVAYAREALEGAGDEP